MKPTQRLIRLIKTPIAPTPFPEYMLQSARPGDLLFFDAVSHPFLVGDLRHRKDSHPLKDVNVIAVSRVEVDDAEFVQAEASDAPGDSPALAPGSVPSVATAYVHSPEEIALLGALANLPRLDQSCEDARVRIGFASFFEQAPVSLASVAAFLKIFGEILAVELGLHEETRRSYASLLADLRAVRRVLGLSDAEKAP